MRTYTPGPGESISCTCKELERLSSVHNETIQATFNDVQITAKVGMTAGDLQQAWREETDRSRAEYEASPEYKERQEEMKRCDAEKKSLLQVALADAPVMEFSDEEGWRKVASSNTDPYGGRVIRYAEEWARLMQVRIANGEPLESCAEELSHLADDDGITGFMYGCAVSILAGTWKHGEDLRRWHNKETQIGDEGDKANESGGVLNPAMLQIGGAS